MSTAGILMGSEGVDQLHTTTPTGRRPLRKMSDMSFRSSLQGSALTVIQEAPVHKPLRRAGDSAPTHKTAARVLCWHEEVVCEPEPNPTWELQAGEAQGMSRELERPRTAPPKHNEARKNYHADFFGHQDVLRYRHSGGICPDEYKFAETRMSAPSLEVKRPASAREAYTDARMSYSYNRVRSLMSCVTY